MRAVAAVDWATLYVSKPAQPEPAVAISGDRDEDEAAAVGRYGHFRRAAWKPRTLGRVDREADTARGWPTSQADCRDDEQPGRHDCGGDRRPPGVAEAGGRRRLDRS